MLIFGLAFSGDVRNLPILIDNEDAVFGHLIVDNLANDTRVVITNGTYSEGINQVEIGDYFAVILIPANFRKRYDS